MILLEPFIVYLEKALI